MPMRKITLLITLLFCLTLTGSTALSQTNIQVYLPLIANLDTSAWLGPDGGSVVAVALDPQNPETVYAGTWGRGVFKSVDGGASWLPATNGLDNLYIQSLAVDPLVPSVLYAGTYKDGMYKSLDGGQSWFAINTNIQAEAIVYTIAIDRSDSNYIYIGTRGISNNGEPPWNGVAYRSTDGGANWEKMITSLGGRDAQDWVYSLAVHPIYPSRVYAAGHGTGPFRSVDRGDTWLFIGDDTVDDSGRAIAADPHSVSPIVLYYGVWHGAGIYKSTDGGNNWEHHQSGLWGTKIYQIAMDPQVRDTLYLATFTTGVIKSIDGGEEWKRMGLDGTGIFSLVINPLNSQTVYVGTSNDGIYRSDDGGTTWYHRQSGLQASSVTGLVVDPNNPSRIFASLNGGGVMQSTDDGDTWVDMNIGLLDKAVRGLALDPLHPYLYALTYSTGLYRCDLSSGTAWVPVSIALPEPSLASQQAASLLPGMEPDEEVPSGADEIQSVALLDIAFAPSAPNTAYLGTEGGGVYYSLDGGISWAPTGLTNTTAWSLAVDPVNAQQVYAATNVAGYLPRSSNGGASWEIFETPQVIFNSLAFSPTAPSTLYAGTDGGVYTYTTSGGWQLAGLAGIPIRVIAPDPQNPGIIYAGTDSGAYLSTDDGKTWQPGPLELNGWGVQAITFDPQNKHVVYFNTTVHGILRIYH